MVVRKKTLGEVNININISDKTKPKKKKRRKATKRKGMILAPNFGSVAPIFPAYSFGTAERSKQEEEQFKTKELLLLTQGELKDTRQKLLEYKPVPSVGRSQAPKTILSGSTRDLSKDAIPEAPALTRQQSDDSKRRNEERIKVAREEFDAKRLSTMRASQLPTFNRTPTTNIPAQVTLKPPPLNKPILQRSDSAASDLSDDSMKLMRQESIDKARETMVKARGLERELRPSIQEESAPKLIRPRPPPVSIEEKPTPLVKPAGVIEPVNKPVKPSSPKMFIDIPKDKIVDVLNKQLRRGPPNLPPLRPPRPKYEPAEQSSDEEIDFSNIPPPPAEDEGFESAESSSSEEELDLDDKPKTAEEKEQDRLEFIKQSQENKRKLEFEEMRKREVVVEEGPTEPRIKKGLKEHKKVKEQPLRPPFSKPDKSFFDKEGVLIIEKSKEAQAEDTAKKMKKDFMFNLDIATGQQTYKIAREMGISNPTSYKKKDGGLDRLKKIILERKGYN